METSLEFVETDDAAELAVWSTPPHNETFLLVHGFSLDHSTWLPMAKRIDSAGFQIVMPDLRGHGRSSLGKEAPTPDRLVADLVSIIDALGLTNVHLVGHSLGAFVALEARHSARRLASVKTITSIAGTERSMANPIMRVGARLFNSGPGIWLLRRRVPGRLMISRWFAPKPDEEHLDDIRLLSASCDRETRRRIEAATGSVDLRETFSEPGPPLLVLCGRHDRATQLKHSDLIASSVPGAILGVIEHAGHMVIIEQPEAVAAALTQWVSLGGDLPD